jgi:AcrR family transcriptional regulator
MVEIQDCEKRTRGRPQVRCDEDTRTVIVDAARVQLQESGYASASMNAIAQAAGVSTKTLYRLFPTKADLFDCVVSTRIGQFILAIDPATFSTMDLRQGLEHLLIAYGRLTLSSDTVSILRLVISESDRFPELAANFYEGAIQRTSAAMESWLRHQCELGLIDLDDPHIASGMLRGMMILEPQRAAILRQKAAPRDEEIVARAKMCAGLFLGGCAARR